MEKERSIKVLSLVALIVAILCLTIAFAALSQTLTINGSVNVDATTWDIHFKKSQTPTEIIGSATFTEPSVTDTKISGFNATVIKPGDKVIYYFDIVNNGTMDAKISEITKPKHEFDKCFNLAAEGDCAAYDFNGDMVINPTDKAVYNRMINSTIKYEVYYEDGITKVSVGDLLNAGDTKKIMLIFEYLSTASTLPTGPMKIISGDIIINYVQSK